MTTDHLGFFLNILLQGPEQRLLTVLVLHPGRMQCYVNSGTSSHFSGEKGFTWYSIQLGSAVLCILLSVCVYSHDGPLHADAQGCGDLVEGLQEGLGHIIVSAGEEH